MPRCVLMTWVSSQKRWTKLYRGVRYYVSTRQLNCGPTQADSLLAANDWWTAKRAEIDGKPKAKPGTPEAVKALLEAWAGCPLDGEEETAAAIAGMVDQYGGKFPAEVTAAILGPERVQEMARTVDALLEPESLPEATTIGGLTARWVAAERNRIQTGRIGPDRADSNRRCLTHFADWLGQGSPVSCIDESKWLDWYGYLLAV